jgi:chemotaxis protein methyltransferase CheR
MNEFTPQQWTAIRDRLAERFGLYLDDSRMLHGRTLVEARIRTLGLTPMAYQAFITTSAGVRELHTLAEQLANHETQFFRNPAHFRCLREAILPDIHQQRLITRPLRCWSAGCATGEEAYSLAMVALSVWGSPPLRPVQIWGSDLSNSALERARLGEYRGRTLTNVQPQYRHWFEPTDAGLRIGSAARSLVQFEQHNLLDPLPDWASELDVVFCQNVTIYFQLATCKRLIERIYQAMAVGGYLLLGFSESLWGIFDGFETVELDGAFVYRKGATPAAPRRTALAPNAQAPASNASAPPATMPIRRINRPLQPPPAAKSASQLEQARHLRDNGQQRTALLLLSQLAPDERSPAALSLLAQLHADLGQPEQAAAEARRALELDVMQDAAYLVLGMLELQNSAWGEATRYLERALYLVPTSPTVSFYLAESYRHQGRVDAARREYRNTMRKLNDVAPTALLDGVAAGWLHATCGRWLESLDKTFHEHS